MAQSLFYSGDIIGGNIKNCMHVAQRIWIITNVCSTHGKRFMHRRCYDKQAKQGSLGTELAPGKRHTCNRLKHVLQREREMPALDALYNNKYAGA